MFLIEEDSNELTAFLETLSRAEKRVLYDIAHYCRRDHCLVNEDLFRVMGRWNTIKELYQGPHLSRVPKSPKKKDLEKTP